MAFLNLPKVQISNLQSFNIQLKSFGENICAHFMSTEVKEHPPNIVDSLRKVSLSEHGFQWPITCDKQRYYLDLAKSRGRIGSIASQQCLYQLSILCK